MSVRFDLEVAPFSHHLPPHVDHINGLPALRDAFPDASSSPGRAHRVPRPSRPGASLVRMPLHHRFWPEKACRRTALPLRRPPSLEGCGWRATIIDRPGSRTLFILPPRGTPRASWPSHPKDGSFSPPDSWVTCFRVRVSPHLLHRYDDYLNTSTALRPSGPASSASPQGTFAGREAVSRAFAAARRAALEVRERILGDTGRRGILGTSMTELRDELTLYSQDNIFGAAASAPPSEKPRRNSK